MEIFYHPQFIRLEYSFLLQILTSQDFVTQTLVTWIPEKLYQGKYKIS